MPLLFIFNQPAILKPTCNINKTLQASAYLVNYLICSLPSIKLTVRHDPTLIYPTIDYQLFRLALVGLYKPDRARLLKVHNEGKYRMKEIKNHPSQTPMCDCLQFAFTPRLAPCVRPASTQPPRLNHHAVTTTVTIITVGVGSTLGRRKTH